VRRPAFDFRAAILRVFHDCASVRCLVVWRIAFAPTLRPALDRSANDGAAVGRAAVDARAERSDIRQQPGLGTYNLARPVPEWRFGPIRVNVATLDEPLDVNGHSLARGLKSLTSALAKRFRIQNGLARLGQSRPRPSFEYPDYFRFLICLLTFYSVSTRDKRNNRTRDTEEDIEDY
jgi:hypothetical protein